MISGRFGENGELFFEIELIASNGEVFPVEVLLDTGFTTGFLAINSQDLDALDWSLIAPQIEMQTARGEGFFDIYEAWVIIDGQDLPKLHRYQKSLLPALSASRFAGQLKTNLKHLSLENSLL